MQAALRGPTTAASTAAPCKPSTQRPRAVLARASEQQQPVRGVAACPAPAGWGQAVPRRCTPHTVPQSQGPIFLAGLLAVGTVLTAVPVMPVPAAHAESLEVGWGGADGGAPAACAAMVANRRPILSAPSAHSAAPPGCQPLTPGAQEAGAAGAAAPGVSAGALALGARARICIAHRPRDTLLHCRTHCCTHCRTTRRRVKAEQAQQPREEIPGVTKGFGSDSEEDLGGWRGRAWASVRVRVCGAFGQRARTRMWARAAAHPSVRLPRGAQPSAVLSQRRAKLRWPRRARRRTRSRRRAWTRSSRASSR